MEPRHTTVLHFRPDPEESDSDTNSSIAPTLTRSSIFSSIIQPGIGSLSGRFVRGFGKTIIHGIESVTVIRSRLTYIQSLCPLSDETPPEDVHQIYDDLLEFARCDEFLPRQ